MSTIHVLFLFIIKQTRNFGPEISQFGGHIFNCFEIIKFCKNRNILLAVEAIMIKKLKPKLNQHLGPDKGSRITINIFK